MPSKKFSRLVKAYKVVLSSYLRSRFRPIPMVTHLFLTRKCNLNCGYCCVRDPSKKELDEGEMKRVIDKLHSLGCRYICFYGGEPTLRKDLAALVEHANKKHIFTVVATNGVLLTPEYIGRLGKAGLDAVSTSVDSVTGFKHSKKSYAAHKKVLSDLVKAREKFGFMVAVNIVLTKKNIDEVIETIRLVNRLKLPAAVGLINENTCSGKPLDKALFFSRPEEKEKLCRVVDEIIKLKKNGQNIFEPMQYLKDMKKFVKKEIDWYCCAGKHYFSVDCDGKFQICAALPAEDVSIFDVGRDYFSRFREIREKRLARCRKVCFSDALYGVSITARQPFYILKEAVNLLYRRH